MRRFREGGGVRALATPLLAVAALLWAREGLPALERAIRPGTPGAGSAAGLARPTPSPRRAPMTPECAREATPPGTGGAGTAWLVRIYPVVPCDPARLADLVLSRVARVDGWELHVLGANLVVRAPQRVHDDVTALLEPEIKGALAHPEILRAYDVRALAAVVGDRDGSVAAGSAVADIAGVLKADCPCSQIVVRGDTVEVTATALTHARIEHVLFAWHHDLAPARARFADVTGGPEIDLVPTRYRPPEERDAQPIMTPAEMLAQMRTSVRLERAPFRDALATLQRRIGLPLEVHAGLLAERAERPVKLVARWAPLIQVLDLVAAQVSERGDVRWSYDGRTVRFAWRFRAEFDEWAAGETPFVTALATGPPAPGPPLDQSANGFAKK